MSKELINYQHQDEAIERFKNSEYFALFIDMGLGKSRIAIKIAEHKFAKGEIDAVMIIAPNGVHSQWIEEQFPEHCNVPYKAFTWSSARRTTNRYQWELEEFLTPKMKRLKVFAVNVEAFQSDSIISTVAAYVKNNKVFIVVDEATRIKTPTTKRTKLIMKLEKYGCRCILTGTPATQSPFGLWSMFEFLHKDYFACNFFIFQARHGVMIQGINQRTGGRYKTLIDEKIWNIALNQLKNIQEMRGKSPLMPDDYLTVASSMGISEKNVKFIERQKTFKKFKRLDELKAQIDDITFYAKKEDCLDLPKKIYVTTKLEMSKAHRKIYDTLKKKLLVEYSGKELTVINKIALTTRLMQICGGYFPYEEETEVKIGVNTKTVIKKKAELIGKKNIKLEALKADMEEVSHFPIIIWANFVVELEAIYAALKNDYKCALYYGKTGKTQRESIIKDFKLNKYDIFIGNLATAGFGLNLQNATTQYSYSNSFYVELRIQGEDRSHRIGVKRDCLYKDLVYKNTIEEKIQRIIVQGKSMNDFFKSQSLIEMLKEEE